MTNKKEKIMYGAYTLMILFFIFNLYLFIFGKGWNAIISEIILFLMIICTTMLMLLVREMKW